MFNGKDVLEEFVCPAETALELKFVRSQDDFFNDKLSFHPVYTHQVFENEKIFGYKNLKIKLYYTPDHLETYINISYDEKVDPVSHKGTHPNDIYKLLLDYIPDDYMTNEDEFLSKVHEQQCFVPPGILLNVYNESDNKRYEVYKVDMSSAGFKQYHKKLQTFVIWFIDAGSFIDADDERWSFYLIYERLLISGRHFYCIVGYATVYLFYAYPDKLRPKISQMLIFPPYQRRGFGGQLLQSIYDDLIPDKDVIDITDPSNEFTALRDFIDCRNALKLSCFNSQVFPSFTPELEKECQIKLKLNKHQFRKIYEILKLRVTDKSNIEEYRQYRLFVKNRLNGPYQKQQKDIAKLAQRGIDQLELVAAVAVTSKEERMRQLQDEYERVEYEYISIIEKLAIV